MIAVKPTNDGEMDTQMALVIKNWKRMFIYSSSEDSDFIAGPFMIDGINLASDITPFSIKKDSRSEAKKSSPRASVKHTKLLIKSPFL